MQIFAPFTEQQVKGIKAWQEDSSVHPFTCINRSSKAHERDTAMKGLHDVGILEVSTNGFYCTTCGYTQKWCHDFMSEHE